MLNNNKKREYIDLATTYSQMRYPKFNLRVGTYIDNYSNIYNTNVLLETFVSSKNGNLITYVTDQYKITSPINWDELTMVKDRFLDKCKLIKDKYIFNNNTAVYEPYEFNKV